MYLRLLFLLGKEVLYQHCLRHLLDLRHHRRRLLNRRQGFLLLRLHLEEDLRVEYFLLRLYHDFDLHHRHLSRQLFLDEYHLFYLLRHRRLM